MSENKSNAFTEWVHKLNNHDRRKIYCIAVGLTGILCKISLQFCCEFINNNKSNICAASDIAKLMKLPTSIIFALHLGFNLAEYKLKKSPNDEDKNEPKNPMQVIGSSAFLTHCTIGILMQTKIIHFLAGNNGE